VKSSWHYFGSIFLLPALGFLVRGTFNIAKVSALSTIRQPFCHASNPPAWYVAASQALIGHETLFDFLRFSSPRRMRKSLCHSGSS
jgi:hypothetical protein